MKPTSRLSHLPTLAALAALWLVPAAVADATTHATRPRAHRVPAVVHPGTPSAARSPASPPAAATTTTPPPSTATSTPATHPTPTTHPTTHPTPTTPATGSAPSASQAARSAARATRTLHRRIAHVHRAVVRAHMAGDPAVSIVDFAFSPASTTIHVGDTITWTNSGKQPHSATADNHSFDTGILRNGQSASHTFTTAGTFTYICIVHPNMHGTVVVLAASTSSSTNTNTNTTTTPTATTATTTSTPTSTAGQLPLTGSDELAAFAIGFAFVAAGFVLRLRARRPAAEDSTP